MQMFLGQLLLHGDLVCKICVLFQWVTTGINDCGAFKRSWAERYLCYNLGREIICLLCFCRFTQFKKFNLERHMKNKHPQVFGYFKCLFFLSFGIKNSQTFVDICKGTFQIFLSIGPILLFISLLFDMTYTDKRSC